MYVIYDLDKTAIFGVGASVDEAWHQVMDECERPIDIEGNPVNDDEWFARFQVRGATAALVAQVKREGGNIAWGYTSAACTVEEEMIAWGDE